ncbi:MAG: aldolase [Prevotella sp.]|nr:aldolase [Prevotella sp.]
MLKLMYITNNPQVALIAQKYGVERIWIDLETLGKEERQKNINSVKSHHSIDDIKTIAPLLNTSEMFVRVNPWNENSAEEIDQVIEAGADLIMLPMWKTTKEVEEFINAVHGRAKTVVLLETKQAVECLDEVLKLDGIDEIHIGLNDLHLSYGLDFMFELLTNGTVESLCNKIKAKGIPYGFGGVARIGEGTLPAEKIILEHYRLDSRMVILSRSFCNTELITSVDEIEEVFKKNVLALREFEKYAASVDEETLMKNKNEVKECVDKIAASIREKKTNE